MPTTSVIVAAKRQLVAQLRAAPALSTIQVTYSHPGDARRDEGIYLGDARSDQAIPVSRAGRRARTETVVVEVVCVAIKPGDTLEDAEARALELVAEVEDALADDATLGGVANEVAQVIRLDSRGFLDQQSGQWGCEVTVEVQVRARLS